MECFQLAPGSAVIAALKHAVEAILHLLHGIIQASRDAETSLLHRASAASRTIGTWQTPCADKMRPDSLFTFQAGPQHRFEGFGAQPSGKLIRTQPQPLATGWIQHAQLVVGLKPPGEIPASPSNRLPHGGELRSTPLTYQLATSTCGWVPARGSKLFTVQSASSTLLWKIRSSRVNPRPSMALPHFS